MQEEQQKLMLVELHLGGYYMAKAISNVKEETRPKQLFCQKKLVLFVLGKRF